MLEKECAAWIRCPGPPARQATGYGWQYVPTGDNNTAITPYTLGAPSQ